MAVTSDVPSIRLILECQRCWKQYYVDAHLVKTIDHGNHFHHTFELSVPDRILAMIWVSNGHEGPFRVRDWTKAPGLSPWQSLW
jgi:hypothetical protein